LRSPRLIRATLATPRCKGGFHRLGKNGLEVATIKAIYALLD
jgi:hypothetical protein